MDIKKILLTKEKQFLINFAGPEGTDALIKYAGLKLLLLLKSKGYLINSNKNYSINELKSEFNFIKKYERLFYEIINILERNRFVIVNSNQIKTTDKVENTLEKYNSLRAEIFEGKFVESRYQCFVIQPFVKLMDSTVPSLFEVAQGKLGYLNLLFPRGDKTIVESIYRTNIQALFNDLIAHYCTEIIEKLGDEIKILEIGAGTGGTTTSVLPILKDKNAKLQYYYTDISGGMVRIGKSKFSSQYDFINYKTLNIDRSPEEQGFKKKSFDIIICSNVLHATPDISRTLANIKSLLSNSNGYLIVNEVVEKLDFNTVTFGLTDGWWSYSDEENRTPHSPMISISKWKKLFEKIELEEGISTKDIEMISRNVSQNIFIYKS